MHPLTPQLQQPGIGITLGVRWSDPDQIRGICVMKYGHRQYIDLLSIEI
jgi:hypothetical protein